MKRRLFLGIPLTDEARKELNRQLHGDISGRVVPSPNWHFTIHFLGDVEEEEHQALEEALEKIDLGVPFEVTITHLGAFPTTRYAKILWVGITEGKEAVATLAKRLEFPLRDLGFKIDERPFVAHLTISRFPRPKNLSKWLEHHSLKKIRMQITELVLYESILGGGAAEYHKLRTYKIRER